MTLFIALFACASEAQDAAPSVPNAVSEAHAAETVVASWEGGELTAAELDSKVQAELDALETQYLLDRYELQAQAVQGLVDEALLQAEADAGGYDSIEALLAVEIEEKTPPPTEAELRELYTMVERQLQGATFEQVRPQLVMQVSQQKMSERYQSYMTELRETRQADVSFPYPDLPRKEVEIAEHDPTLGPDTAPVKIVQFAEYQCYYCGKVAPTLERLLDSYEGKVQLVFKDFPLNNHQDAVPAAIAAHCAGEQGKYWEMNTTLLQKQSRLGTSDLQSYAQDLELDMDSWNTCVSSGEHEAGVQADMAQARELGVQATPTFYVNGVLVAGAHPYERFAELIERELDSP